MNTALCYVRLHGYGLMDNAPSVDEWYIAMAANDVVYVNASRGTAPDAQGFFTYILHPNNCSASDFQYFNTFGNGDESARLINYLQALADGRSFFSLLGDFPLYFKIAINILYIKSNVYYTGGVMDGYFMRCAAIRD